MQAERFFNELFGGNAWGRCGIFHQDNKCKPGLVYVARGDNGTVKVGYANDYEALIARGYANRRQYGMGFILLFVLRTHCARGLERKIHRHLESCRIAKAGGRELFRPTDDQLLWVSRINTFNGHPVTMVPAIDLL